MVGLISSPVKFDTPFMIIRENLFTPQLQVAFNFIQCIVVLLVQVREKGKRKIIEIQMFEAGSRTLISSNILHNFTYMISVLAVQFQ